MRIKELRQASEETYRLLAGRLARHLPALSRCRSTGELHAHPVYRSVAATIGELLTTLDRGDFTSSVAPARAGYRFLAWNVERGTQLAAQVEAFRTHEYLRSCDVLLLTETDVGMARSGNHAVAQTIARALGLHYAFAPCYLSLVKGSGLEYYVEGENQLGLHGNAVLSRYPIGRIRAIPLENGVDKMAGREKRIGCQTALAADIEFPGAPMTAVSMHLDANSTQRHRREQMRTVLDATDRDRLVLLGGDWNTSTYNSSHAFPAILGFCRRVLMGVDHVIRNHYLHPDRRFERDLFRLLESRGFDYRGCNRLGERTGTYRIGDAQARQSLGEWVPSWCFAFIRWALRNHGGECPLKLDWFAARGLRCENPVVIHELREGGGRPLSDHDAIGIDVRM
jgi:endonuclease/exonuclease/phosphatase family metal-dependent hydrolase